MEDQLNPRTHHNDDDEEDEPPTLSSQALAALREFLSEQESHSVSDVTADCTGPGGSSSSSSSVALVSEDWRLSQFWYDRETAETVAREILTLCQMGSLDLEDSNSPRVACIACPTLYAYLKVQFFFPLSHQFFCVFFTKFKFNLIYLLLKCFCFCSDQNIEPKLRVQLLEYDERFAQYGSNFTFYDYNQPEELPLELKHGFSVVIADPPYLVRNLICL